MCVGRHSDNINFIVLKIDEYKNRVGITGMDYLDGVKQFFIKLPQNKMATVCCYSLLAVSCYYAALLTWQLLSITEQSSTWIPVASTQQKTTNALNLNAIKKLQLFGKKQQDTVSAAVVETIDAPKTRLRLTLTGLVASSEPSRALAIIENAGRQDTYAIDESIGNTRARLKRVLTDRVLIEYQGKLETLMLDGEMFTKTTSTTRPVKHDSKQSKNTDLSQLHAELLANPASITDYVRISPVRRNNELVGYRVNPGRKPALFKDVGLLPNDLAVSLNGIDLTNQSEAYGALKQLKEANDIELTVERNNQLHTVYLTLSQ